jgi:hypothetical protein
MCNAHLLMATCTHCDKAAVARGLCQMHYLRYRRHGDAGVVRKSGRPVDPFKVMLRQTFQNCSDRTFERFYLAYRRLQGLGVLQGVAEVSDPASPYAKALKICARPNGSVDVARFSQVAEDWCKWYRAERKLEAEQDVSNMSG